MSPSLSVMFAEHFFPSTKYLLMVSKGVYVRNWENNSTYLTTSISPLAAAQCKHVCPKNNNYVHMARLRTRTICQFWIGTALYQKLHQLVLIIYCINIQYTCIFPQPQQAQNKGVLASLVVRIFTSIPSLSNR